MVLSETPSTIRHMIELKFTSIPTKMWPGYTPENLTKRLAKIGGFKCLTIYEQMPLELTKADKQQHLVSSPILDSQGRWSGILYSIFFCEKAFRDQLKSTTRFGNFWNGFRYLTTVFFFAMVIVLSGGANPLMNTLSVLEMFGAWTIMEIAFNRGLITSFKYSGIGEILGIRLRLIVVGAYSTVWLEIIVLLALLNTWSVYNRDLLLSLFDYFQIFSCLFSLLALSLPFSYFVSIISRDKIDLRYVFPVFFKFLVFSTPLFSGFHDNFSFIKNLLRFNPLNYCFSFVTNPSLSVNVSFSCFLVTISFGYVFFSLIRDKIDPLAWKRLDD